MMQERFVKKFSWDWLHKLKSECGWDNDLLNLLPRFSPKGVFIGRTVVGVRKWATKVSLRQG